MTRQSAPGEEEGREDRPDERGGENRSVADEHALGLLPCVVAADEVDVAAEAERDRRAKVIHAKGEFEAAQTLADAAQRLEEHPAAMQLRILSTMAEVSNERNSTLIFPLPMELLRLVDTLRPGGPAGTEAPAGTARPAAPSHVAAAQQPGGGEQSEQRIAGDQQE